MTTNDLNLAENTEDTGLHMKYVNQLTPDFNVVEDHIDVLFYDLNDAAQVNIIKREEFQDHIPLIIALTDGDDESHNIFPDKVSTVIISDNPAQICQIFQTIWTEPSYIGVDFNDFRNFFTQYGYEKIYTHYSLTAPNVEQLSEQIQQLGSNLSRSAYDPIFVKLEMTDWNTDTVNTITNMIETIAINEDQSMYVFNQLNEERYPKGTHFALHLFIGRDAISPPRAKHVTQLTPDFNILEDRIDALFYDLNDDAQVNIIKREEFQDHIPLIIALTDDKQHKIVPDEASTVIIADNPAQICQIFQTIWTEPSYIGVDFNDVSYFFNTSSFNASFFNEWAESTKIYTYYSFTAPNVEQLSEQIQQLKSNIPSIYAQDPIFAKLEITDWNTDTVDTITNMIETMVENKYHENQIMYVFNELNVEKYPQGTHFALHLFIGKTAILPPRATHVTELISELNMGSNILAKNCFVILYDLDDATQINIAKQKKIEKYPVIALTDKQRKTLPDEATAVIITDNPEQVCQTFQMLWRQMAIIEFQFYYFSKLLYKEKIYTHYYFTASSVEQLCEQIQQQILSKTPISADNSIFFKLETNESIETLDPIVEIMNLNDLDVHWEFTTFELNEKKYPEGTHFALHLFIGKAAENSTIADDENDI